jgi:radical SAM-linked protein
LRKFINKNISNEDLFHAVETAYRQGWNLVKLYFMIGLPTETDSDIGELVDLIRQVGKIGRRVKGGKNVNASIGTFVPKAFTPFQWDRFEDLRTINSRLDYLKAAVRFPGSRLKWQNPQEAFIEGVLSRGDRRIGEVLLRAFQLGCRFDGWSEMFKWDLWMKAFEETGIDPHFYNREIRLQEVLPWDFIDIGVSKKFLLKERERSFKQVQTYDCKWGECRGCGIPGNYADIKLASPPRPGDMEALNQLPAGQAAKNLNGCAATGLASEGESQGSMQQRQQPEFSEVQACQSRAYVLHSWKEGPARFLSHLNVMKLMEQALLRSGIALRFTQGFNPHPKFITSPAIPLGMASRSEYIQFEAHCELPDRLFSQINDFLMEGLVVQRIQPLSGGACGSIGRPLQASYRAALDGPFEIRPSADVTELVGRINDLVDHLADHRKGNDFWCSSKEHNLISDLTLMGEEPLEIAFSLSINPDTGVLPKPREFLEQTLNCPSDLARRFLISKTDVRFD